MPGANYNRVFGVSHFENRPYYGGHYGSDNNNNFSLFSAGGLDFVVLALDNDAAFDPAVLAWGDSVLTAYPNRPAIVSAHNLIGPGDPADFSDPGQPSTTSYEGSDEAFNSPDADMFNAARMTAKYNTWMRRGHRAPQANPVAGQKVSGPSSVGSEVT